MVICDYSNEDLPKFENLKKTDQFQIMRSPPIDGTPWIGVSSDGNLERLVKFPYLPTSFSHSVHVLHYVRTKLN